MSEKECFKCNTVKPLSEFYKHAQMGDGHLNKCKECTKSDVAEHRAENIDKIRAYDRARGCRQSRDYRKKYAKRYPKKYKAQVMVGNAVRDGKLERQPCCICGDPKVHAHHDDYDKPLLVRWMCPAHHHQWHAKHGEARNGV